jgi:hypothetical protein
VHSATLKYLADEEGARTLFRRDFDRFPFAFNHTLQNSGYFTLDALKDLASRMATKPNRWYCEEGDTKPRNGWNAGSSRRSLEDSIAGVAHHKSLVILKRIQEDPEYEQLLFDLQEELSDLTGTDVASRYRDGLMTVLITSPGRITPYHLDGEANLLMQILGTKSVYIFDGNDREILPFQELERFWSGDVKAPLYKEHLQSRAWEYELAPGKGVTNPVTFPHWVQNGPQVSISLSVNFKRAIDNSADAYKVNGQLRKFGLRPLQPGNVSVVDHTKGVAYRTAKRVKSYLGTRSLK